MFRSERRGSALIEFAIVTPLLMLFVLGAAEFGRVYFAAITVANAARVAAQFGSQEGHNSDFPGMNAAAQAEAADLGTISNFPSNFCRCPDGTAPACTSGATCAGFGAPEVFIKDSVVKSVSLIMKYPGFPATITVSRVAVFRAQ
ncbi:MAG TPA: TadE family protein [Gemmatimonadaceae bacterium]|nr:TadE family protein [Gemmatimonadaceae bacterium]